MPADRDPVYFVKACFSGWEKRLPGVEKADFTSDSRMAVYQKDGTLHIVTLGTVNEENIPGVSSYQLFKRGSEECLLYYSKADRQLNIRCTGKDDKYNNVDAWLLSADGHALLKKVIRDKDHQTLSIDIVDNKDERVIWDGGPSTDWVMDSHGGQVAFIAKDQEGKNRIWYYKTGMAGAAEIATGASRGIDSGLTIGKLLNFSKDGSMLFFNLTKELPKSDPNMVSVDVWSYRDAKFQAEQLDEASHSGRKDYLASISLAGVFPIRCWQHDEGSSAAISPDGSFLILNQTQGGIGENSWSQAARWKYAVVDIRTGKTLHIDGYRVWHFSPSGRFLELFDPSAGISTFELSTGIIRPIAAGVSIAVDDRENDTKGNIHTRWAFPVGWLAGDKAMIVQDSYDFWELDPMRKRPPICLTHHEGARTKTTYCLAIGYPPGQLVTGDILILAAFNHRNKDNGFYRILLHKEQIPQKLTMGPYGYYAQHSGIGKPIVIASGASVYMVSRESISESPNYFVTRDFKSFLPLSEVYPEKKYNWTRSELINFKTSDGRDEQGVLYLPEDFDPHKKYPVIFHYYERKSDFLNCYHNAINLGSGGGMSDLAIAWFTSHGYLVFTPDFHYALGKPGESVLQTVMGAADFFKTFSYVDSKHMGLQGHSFGGYETDYLITHTNAFAAACSSAGITDFVSNYLDLIFGRLFNFWYETDICRMGTTLWEHPDYYIRNSPVYYADKVTTPLLLTANKKDGNVSFTQGLEFFTALRRMGKKVWMLQYDREGHGEFKQPEVLDYLLRSTQFFDHYLKGAPVPKWMVEGIPATMKQVDDGLELEPAGVEPGPGLLTPEAQKSIDALKHKKPVKVTFN
jgi:prolyl oligopeptidase family protein